MMWKRGIRKYTVNFDKVSATRLRGCGPKDFPTSWLEIRWDEKTNRGNHVVTSCQIKMCEKLCVYTVGLRSMCCLLWHSFFFRPCRFTFHPSWIFTLSIAMYNTVRQTVASGPSLSKAERRWWELPLWTLKKTRDHRKKAMIKGNSTNLCACKMLWQNGDIWWLADCQDEVRGYNCCQWWKYDAPIYVWPAFYNALIAITIEITSSIGVFYRPI